MGKVDFIELAEYCVKRAKENSAPNIKKYVKTLYISISEDNNVKLSTTPHVLQGTYQCILMHEYSQIPISNIYYWYEIEYINSEGCVLTSDLGDGFNLVSYKHKHSSSSIILRFQDKYLYSNYDFRRVWELYTKIKDIPLESERELIISLYYKDEHVLNLEKQIEDFKFTNHLLEQERDQYKDMLDEIKDLVNSNK